MKKLAITSLFLTLIFILCVITNTIYAQDIDSFPYQEDFENGTGGWTIQGSITSWALGAPSSSIINSAASGENAWVTNLSGTHFPSENGWVESPSFDISSLTTPYLQFNIWWETTDIDNDGGTIQTSVDSGNSWQTLTTDIGNEPAGEIYNWMNQFAIFGISGEAGWSDSSGNWKTAIYPLENFIGATDIKFRILFGCDGFVQSEGIAFDKFQISESFCYAGEEEDYNDAIDFETGQPFESFDFDSNTIYYYCVPNGQNLDLNSLVDNSGGLDRTSFENRWKFVKGPFGPRGPKVVTLSNNQEADFPNTGNGLDQLFTFEYSVDSASCSDSAMVNICMDNDLVATETTTIYTCTNSSNGEENEFIEVANELFNAFNLEQIRDLDNVWYDDTSGSDGPEIIISDSAPIQTGIYRYEDHTMNEIIANVVELSCSNEGISLSFDNGQTTNDGTNDFFEVDVMIASTGNDFKMGDGKLTFKYNDAAFGEFVNIYNNLEITAPDGFIAGETVSNSDEKIYETIVLDNTNGITFPDFGEEYSSSDSNVFRFSVSFKQKNVVPLPNVTSTPSKLCRIKLRYEDFHEQSMLEFESDGIYDNKFTTACVWNSGRYQNNLDGDLDILGGGINNCNIEERTLIYDDTYNNTLSIVENELPQEITVYPNPTNGKLHVKGNITNIKTMGIYSVMGQKVLEIKTGFDELDLSGLQSGIYFIKVNIETTSKTFKIIKQ